MRRRRGEGYNMLTVSKMYQTYLDKSTPFITYRWAGTAGLFVLFALRIIFAQGWYIGMKETFAGA